MKDSKADSYEWIALRTPVSFAHYENWIAEKNQGEMSYLEENKEVRQNPSQHFPKMKSIIVFTQNYFPVDEKAHPHFSGLKIAHYARSKDYHLWYRKQLQEVAEKLKSQFPNEEFLTYTDAVPLLERDHAMQAGLGWVGKNTCVIQRKQGSLFFIGEILSSLEVDNEPEVSRDFCGSCRACMDACPTGAIENERVLNANKCIAYWNIESKNVAPLEIRSKMGDWFFGCDICQTVCPWNVKIFSHVEGFQQTSSRGSNMLEDLHWILSTSNKKIVKAVADTPLSRAGGRGLKRNALIVIGNMRLTELKADVEVYEDHPQLAELAQWALKQLKT